MFELKHALAVTARPLRRVLVAGATRTWPPYSRLFLVPERAPWVTAREMVELAALARSLGVRLGDVRWAAEVRRQAIFYGSHFDLLARGWAGVGNRLGVAYYHGRPGTPGAPEFDDCYRRLQAGHERVDRVQVTHSEMREIILSTGVEPGKVFTIPIGINLRYFPFRDSVARAAVRARYGISENAAVVGSIQKDGVGWGEGMEPKLIKGPDVFLRTVALLRERLPELHVLAAGPARGYVLAGLRELGVPHVHVFPNPGGADLEEVGRLFQALDLYIVASRQEGGPKAVLESMASGVPLVTTRVGHAMDVVRHGDNGWMVDVEDVEGLAHWAEHALAHPEETAEVVRRARCTAEENSYDAQLPLWREFMRGFVEAA